MGKKEKEFTEEVVVSEEVKEEKPQETKKLFSQPKKEGGTRAY